ncbi:MAG: translation initiation factor IF-3 [Oscillospiraceae bacterium]|nr:translation initiation factor IF-3 [Oscillospiraceae bacterium]
MICIKQDLLINEQIRVKEVQVIDESGTQLGTMSTSEAIDMAMSKSKDLVLVSGNVSNPVCKIMDYGKFKFEQSKREKESKKKQTVAQLKEIRVTPNIEDHDFSFKAKNARKFLESGDKVKVTVRFRGRELNHAKLGEAVLNKFVEELEEVSTVEKSAKLEGKNMFLILAPLK